MTFPATNEFVESILRKVLTTAELLRIPKHPEHRDVVLAILSLKLERRYPYTERELNVYLIEQLNAMNAHVDHATCRRYLVDTGFMKRDRAGMRYFLNYPKLEETLSDAACQDAWAQVQVILTERRKAMSNEIDVFVQNPTGSTIKNKHNEQTFELLEAVELIAPYPCAYGFIPGTLAEDGECLDCYVLKAPRIPSGTTVNCVPVGILEVSEDGKADHKILAVIAGKSEVIDTQTVESIKQFITTIAAQFPEKSWEIGEILPQPEAFRLIAKASNSAT